MSSIFRRHRDIFKDFWLPKQEVKNILLELKKYDLKINTKKCEFFTKEIFYLGYIIKENTIRISEEKTLAIKNFLIPKNRKNLQQFLGLNSYRRRY